MITRRVTRLVRVPDLRAFQRAILELAGVTNGAAASRSCTVVVATHAAAAELRRTIENLLLDESRGSAVLLPDLVTRTGFYARLSERLPGTPPLLTEFEREVIFRLAARAAVAAGSRAPFRLRPGLVSAILGFYDELRRSQRTVHHFHRLVAGELIVAADGDRGAERLLQQAEFLATAFADFENRVANSGRIDEHGLRALLLQSPVLRPYRHVIVTVADQATDSYGLWAADFDLLARIPGVERIDVVATERVLASGFHQRLHERHLPGIEEVRMGVDSGAPVLLLSAQATPAGRPSHIHVCRDREEELVAVARWLKRPERSRLPAFERMGVVFQRPLPYLYLAREVFGSAHIPYQATDSLPLAGEPFVAALDLVFTFLVAEGTRTATVELLGSPHWAFVDPVSGRPIEREDIAALDTLFREVKFLGGWGQLASLAFESSRPDHLVAKRSGHYFAEGAGTRGRASAALRAAAATAEELRAVVDSSRASTQLEELRRFVVRHERLPSAGDPWQARHLRARAAALAGLDGLREAHARYDNEPVPFVQLAAALRRWIEATTFAPRSGDDGVLMLDPAAASFADLDSIRIVGLVHSDWPERSGTNIFFPSKLLEPLGWPSPAQRLTGSRARFQDLLRLPTRSVAVSTFLLEDDGNVLPSVFADEVSSSGLATELESWDVPARIFDHEGLAIDPVETGAVHGEAGQWLALRQWLPPVDAAQFHGVAGARQPGVYAVSRLERYLECPFKYFAASVLALDEERAEESGLTPLERGQLLHVVFEMFFAAWHARGQRAITGATLKDALALFEEVAEAELGNLRESDRALERNYLLGSAVGSGLAERVFAFEIEHGIGVIERLLEHVLEGTFVFRGPDGSREVRLRAKADRIDLLEDGTLRIIDYKIGRAPKMSRVLQLPVYGVCAGQQLAGRLGREWSVSRAGYVAFREKNAFVPLGGPAGNLEKALADGELRLVGAVTAIEQGHFPPRPDEPWLCSRCGYALVCRKDYVGDD